MSDNGTTHEDFNKMKPKELQAEVQHDLKDYFKPGDAAGQHGTSGERLKDAAVAFENTLKQDNHVKDLAEAIKKGTPGTPEWDQLMKDVQKQLEGNNSQIAQVTERQTQAGKQLVAAHTQINAGEHLGNMTISGTA